MSTDLTPLPHEHPHLRALTGVRGLAALWVVGYHFQKHIYTLLPNSTVIRPLLEGGFLGVDLFFGLSGFILAYNYLHRMGERFSPKMVGRFLWLRLARVWPVHVFTLNAVLLLVLGADFLSMHLNSSESVRYNIQAYMENLSLTQVWWGGGLSFNGPAWSVSAEWFAYLLFPLVALLVLRVRGVFPAIGAVLGCYVGFLTLYWYLHWAGAGATSGALLRVTFEFVAGCLLFRIWEATTSGRLWSVALILCAAGLVIAVWILPSDGYHGVVLAPLLGILILSLAHSTGTVPRLLSAPLAVFAGEASYSMYMTHEVVNQVVSKVLPANQFEHDPIILRVGVLGIYAVLVMAAAVGTYKFVEVPARIRMRALYQAERKDAI